MSAIEYREYTLVCDGDDGRCRAQFGPASIERSRAELRKLAAKAGWTHVHKEGRMRRFDSDFCPAHKPAATPGQVSS